MCRCRVDYETHDYHLIADGVCDVWCVMCRRRADYEIRDYDPSAVAEAFQPGMSTVSPSGKHSNVCLVSNKCTVASPAFGPQPTSHPIGNCNLLTTAYDVSLFFSCDLLTTTSTTSPILPHSLP